MSGIEKRPGAGLLAVGRITRPHGLRGAVVVECMSDYEKRFEPGARLMLERGSALAEVEVRTCSRRGDRLVIGLAGFETRSEVEDLRGCILKIPEDRAAPLAEGEYWPHELEGMKVVSSEGSELGEVADLLETPAHETLLVTGGPGGEFMVPFVAEFVMDVDRENGVITLEVIEGMVPGS